MTTDRWREAEEQLRQDATYWRQRGVTGSWWKRAWEVLRTWGSPFARLERYTVSEDRTCVSCEDERGRSTHVLLRGFVEVLVAGLRDEDSEVRQAAALSLMHQANPSTLEALVQALKDPDNTVRNFSAQALGDIKDPRALEPLIEVVLRDKEDLVQFQASRALERITGKKFGQNGKTWQQWWQQEKAKTP